ncbi:cytochrome c oxidase subunit 5B, mitochondrial-like [Thrips palmi]|uniref:Cytochrome c oxidase subunit 5B, mitochondrial-like n=1 Tax=Thrips palmi TaxID=161013 RepID=A0A6P8ZN96_THRPL|nr:cytochrome c oxidase subunit 5B, mitochondrial-like [Thrips palmi]
MALQRVLCSVSRRSFSTARLGGLFKASDNLPNPLEHASGLERKQLLAELQGNEDPFDMNIQKRGVCTKEKPHVVYSSFHERLVGCICEEDSENVVWMWLRQSEPKRCACGYWFKLQKVEDH